MVLQGERCRISPACRRGCAARIARRAIARRELSGATKHWRWGMSKRCERARRNARAYPGEVRIVELASLRGAPSRAERPLGLAGEIRIKLALHLPRLALLRGRFLERRCRFILLFGPARGFFCCACILALLARCSLSRGFYRCALDLACLPG